METKKDPFERGERWGLIRPVAKEPYDCDRKRTESKPNN